MVLFPVVERLMRVASNNIAAADRRTWPLWGAFVVLHAVLFFLDLYPSSRRPFGDEVMYRALAEGAARGTPGTLELLWPPLYVWVLTPFARWGANWTLAVSSLQVALLGLSALLFHDLLKRMTGSPAVARLGQAFMLLDPHLAAFAHYAWPEVIYIAFLVLLMWLLVARPWRHVWWVFAGVATGILCLTKSVLQPYLPLMVLPLAQNLGWRRAAVSALGIAAVAAVVLGPISFANWRTHGTFVIADASRFNLWLGLNAEGRRSAVYDQAGTEFQRFQESANSFAERQAILTDRITSLVRERGVTDLARHQWPTQFFRLLDSRTFLTEQLAGGPFQLIGVGYVEPSPMLSGLLRVWNIAFYALVLAAAGVGLCTVPVRERPWLQLLFGTLVYGLCLFFLVEARSRYRLPLMVPLWTAAAAALVFRAHNVARWRVVVGGAVSCLLLLFAFGADYLP